ncbi:hypothetical protein F5Y00DRAFT_266451 [Daldinia vernicosa]|uniref:uncharacterized protein n=1 Tax=Daldinia vernicosa TaxID=114800 RepID=UPI0020083CC2|nr:uncharacterized protein F5Y00DRAFT_266451 [Daldinia vernicosa]KAI0844530.1 hypothetical protein F5Y00DRAFT_266451 [Daldinia vernicosa]
MSSQQRDPKITSKNLAYSSDLPPFLAKLRGQHQQQRDSDTPDPILAARRRAARPRSASEEAEDAPLVVDEAGNTVTLPSGADADVPADDDAGGRNDTGADNAKEREREKIASIGAGKKRKVGRVIGGTEEDEEQKPFKNIKGREKEESSSAKNSDKPAVDAKSGTKQTKKKAKKIKLSFNDDGD